MNTWVSLPERSENRKLFDFYFKIRPFEADGKLYEKLWVTYTQVIVMGTLGRAFILIWWNKEASGYFIGKSINESSLREYSFYNKANETLHMLLITSCVYSMATDCFLNISTQLALIINLHLVMLQRYNRARVENVLNKRYKEKP